MNGTVSGFTSVNGDTTTPPTATAPVPASTALTPAEAVTYPTSPAPAAPPLPSTAGAKRKRDTKPAMKFYAVRVGKAPGIYHSWPECLDQVRGYPRAAFKSFTSLTDAQAFANNEHASAGAGGAGSGKFYAVQSGRNPGVYTSWPDVLEQITGWKGPKHKVFKTRMEAELFIAEGRLNLTAAPLMHGDTTADTIETSEMGTLAKRQRSLPKGNLKTEPPSSPLPTNGREYSPGTAPLPSSTTDSFDASLTLDQTTGTARYKTAAELSKTKYFSTSPVASAPVRIYTDGSALSNGQAGAIGGVGVYFGPLDGRNVSEPLTGTKQTNQRAELTAVLRALEVAPRDRRIVIYSDSQYAIRCCTEWFVRWRSNGWHNAAHKPVENRDLVGKIVEMLEERFRLNRHRVAHDVEDEDGDDGGGVEKRGHWDHGPAGVRFEWVKGHAKDEGNNAADELAVNGARTAKELGEDVVLD